MGLLWHNGDWKCECRVQMIVQVLGGTMNTMNNEPQTNIRPLSPLSRDNPHSGFLLSSDLNLNLHLLLQ
jgi:hypothetical protein